MMEARTFWERWFSGWSLLGRSGGRGQGAESDMLLGSSHSSSEINAIITPLPLLALCLTVHPKYVSIAC